MKSDEIIEGVGSMSRFQIFLLFAVLGVRTVIPWGMLMMAFAAVPPDQWWCNHTGIGNSSGPDTCPGQNSDNITCSFVYSDEKETVVNEWDLLCAKGYVGNLITSIQMAGVLVGCLLGGQSSDVFGRKKTYLLSVFCHAVFNLVAAFSVSWQMFITFRFFIGVSLGVPLSVGIPYFMEFVGQRWRSIVTVVPFWEVGSCLLSLTCWLRPRWSDIQIITAAIHVPFIAALFFVPESFRWLAVQGRLDEAEGVVDKMARYNRREKVGYTRETLKQIADEERGLREAGSRYTYIDIYRTWNLCWKSLIIQFSWMSMSFVYYGIGFGVGKLTGILYVNMFLVSIISLPGRIVIFLVVNRVGRRWCIFVSFLLATLAAFAVVIVVKTDSSEEVRGTATRVLALACRFGVTCAWTVMLMHSGEAYPTSIRNVGYGAANTAARIGSIVSPFIFALGGKDLLPSFLIIGFLMAACGVLCLFLPETKGTPLEDTLASTNDQKDAPRAEQESKDVGVKHTDPDVGLKHKGPDVGLKHKDPDVGLKHKGPDVGLKHKDPDVGLKHKGPDAVHTKL